MPLNIMIAWALIASLAFGSFVLLPIMKYLLRMSSAQIFDVLILQGLCYGVLLMFGMLVQ